MRKFKELGDAVAAIRRLRATGGCQSVWRGRFLKALRKLEKAEQGQLVSGKRDRKIGLGDQPSSLRRASEKCSCSLNETGRAGDLGFYLFNFWTMEYGRAMRVVRSAHGLSQRQLADRIGVSPSHLSLIESGKRDPSLKLLGEIAGSLDVPMHLLTLLASDVGDIDDPKHAEHIADVAKALLRVLVAEGQPTLPMGKLT